MRWPGAAKRRHVRTTEPEGTCTLTDEGCAVRLPGTYSCVFLTELRRWKRREVGAVQAGARIHIPEQHPMVEQHKDSIQFNLVGYSWQQVRFSVTLL